MEVTKTHKIAPLHIRPGDTLTVHYKEEMRSNNELTGYKSHQLVAHDFTEPTVVDTIVIAKINDEYGLRTGVAVMIGDAK